MVRYHLPPGQPGVGRAEESIDFEQFAIELDGYSGSDIKLVCKEAAMKPLRRIMTQIELVTDDDNIKWDRQADPKSVPPLG